MPRNLRRHAWRSVQRATQLEGLAPHTTELCVLRSAQRIDFFRLSASRRSCLAAFWNIPTRDTWRCVGFLLHAWRFDPHDTLPGSQHFCLYDTAKQRPQSTCLKLSTRIVACQPLAYFDKDIVTPKRGSSLLSLAHRRTEPFSRLLFF